MKAYVSFIVAGDTTRHTSIVRHSLLSYSWQWRVAEQHTQNALLHFHYNSAYANALQFTLYVHCLSSYFPPALLSTRIVRTVPRNSFLLVRKLSHHFNIIFCLFPLHVDSTWYRYFRIRPLKSRPLCCPETSDINQPVTRRNIPQKWIQCHCVFSRVRFPNDTISCAFGCDRLRDVRFFSLTFRMASESFCVGSDNGLPAVQPLHEYAASHLISARALDKKSSLQDTGHSTQDTGHSTQGTGHPKPQLHKIFPSITWVMPPQGATTDCCLCLATCRWRRKPRRCVVVLTSFGARHTWVQTVSLLLWNTCWCLLNKMSKQATGYSF